VTVAMTRGAIAVVAAIVVGGCGGGEEQEQVFRPADATRIANVRPVTPGWTWPQQPEKRSRNSEKEGQADPTDALLVELRRQTADVVSLREAGNKWRDGDKLANLVANVLASAADAHDLMAPFNAFSRGWAESYGRITKDEELDGLGDKAWLLRTTTDYGGREVTIHWRRGNLVVEAHVTDSGSAQATSRLPHVPGWTRSTRLREQARSHAQQRRVLDTQRGECSRMTPDDGARPAVLCPPPECSRLSPESCGLPFWGVESRP
jgi:hypothetical protein